MSNIRLHNFPRENLFNCLKKCSRNIAEHSDVMEIMQNLKSRIIFLSCFFPFHCFTFCCCYETFQSVSSTKTFDLTSVCIQVSIDTHRKRSGVK